MIYSTCLDIYMYIIVLIYVKQVNKSEHEFSAIFFTPQGETVDTDHLSELTEEEYEVGFVRSQQKGFMKIDSKYLIPFFTRRFTQQASSAEDTGYKKYV